MRFSVFCFVFVLFCIVFVLRVATAMQIILSLARWSEGVNEKQKKT